MACRKHTSKRLHLSSAKLTPDTWVSVLGTTRHKAIRLSRLRHLARPAAPEQRQRARDRRRRAPQAPVLPRRVRVHLDPVAQRDESAAEEDDALLGAAHAARP